jgi:spore maturation protein CgeB
MLGGSGWEDKAMPANVNYVGHVYTRDHNAFNCSARAVLNVNRDSMASYGFSPPTRIFEAAGAAACLITDAWEGIETFLTPGREVLVAQDADDVVRHLETLDQKKAREIGDAGRRRVLAELINIVPCSFSVCLMKGQRRCSSLGWPRRATPTKKQVKHVHE